LIEKKKKKDNKKKKKKKDGRKATRIFVPLFTSLLLFI